MDDLPKPWGELLHIFRLSPSPLQASLRWLDEGRHSSVPPTPPNFDDVMLCLCNAVPSIHAKENKLILKPKLSEFPPNIQSLLLEFLQLHIHCVSHNVRDQLSRHIEHYYCDCDATTGLLQLLRSRHTASDAQPFAVPNQTMVVPKKRAGGQCIEDLPPPKRMKASSDPPGTPSGADNARDLRLAVESRNTDKIIFLLETLSSASLDDACDVLPRGELVLDESWLMTVWGRVGKKAKGDERVIEVFLKPLCSILIKHSTKGPGRQFVQMMMQISNEFPQIFFSFFSSFVREATELSREQGAFVITLSKQALSKDKQMLIFREILENEQFPVSNIEATTSLYLGFLNLRLPLQAEDVPPLCNFFTTYSKPAAKLFGFAKLLMTYLKQLASVTSLEDLTRMEAVVECNMTSLAPACKAIISKAKKS